MLMTYLVPQQSRRMCFGACLLVLALLVPTMGWGSDGEYPSFTGEAAVSLMHFDYREYRDNGSLLDRENGYLPGVSFSLARAVGGWEAMGRVSHHGDTIDYSGETEAGVPVQTSTSEKLTDISLQLGKDEAFGEGTPAKLYGGIGHRQWRRDIHSTATVRGLLENYRWSYVFLGALASLAQKDSFILALDMRLTRTVNPTIHVDFGGVYDSAMLSLKEKSGFRISLPATLPQANGLQLRIEPFWEEWHFGRSNTESITRNGVSVGTVFEPRSESRAYGVNIGLISTF